MVVEIFVDGDGHVVADAEHSAERVGAQTHVGVLAHVFEALAFLLHGIVGTAGSEHFKTLSCHFHTLAGTLAFHERTAHGEACTRGAEFEEFGVDTAGFYHYLDVLDGAAIVEGDEVHHFAAAVGTHPSFYADFTAVGCGGKEVYYFCSLHIVVAVNCV